MNIQCNVHVSTFAATKNLGTIGGKLPPKGALNLAGEYVFKYTYPLSQEATFAHELTAKMTAHDILVFAAADYQQIYAEENGTMPEAPSSSPFLLNRGRSEGKHGIWGHDITDLFFEAIIIDEKARTISFSMGS